MSVIIGITFLSETDRLYGNDEQSIKKVIQSIEGYEYQSIKILEIKDIYDDRVVGFLANNNPAYIHFSKNQKGNFEWNYIKTSAGQFFATYLIHITNEKADVFKFMVVTNEKNDVAKLLLDVNGKGIEKDFHVKQNSVTWIDLPKGSTYNFKYKYFDENGKELSDDTLTKDRGSLSKLELGINLTSLEVDININSKVKRLCSH